MADDAALGQDGGVVGNLEVPGNAHLACQDAVFAHLRGTGDTALGGHHGVVSDDYVVRNLAQIVNTDTVADDGGFHLGAVHGGIGANLYVVSDDDIPQVLDLFPAAVGARCVAEAVGTDDATGMQDDVVADHHARIDFYAGIDDAVFADGAVVANVDVLVDDGVVSHRGVMAHEGEGAHIDALAEVGVQEPAGPQAAVPACFLLFVGHIFEELGNGRVGVVDPHHGGLYGLFGLKGLVHDEDGGLAAVYEFLVLGIGKEAQGTGFAVFNLGKLGGLGVLVTLYDAAQ